MVTNLSKILAAAAIVIIVVSITGFQEPIQQEPNRQVVRYDKGFIQAMEDVSDRVPKESVLVVSSQEPLVRYFTGRPTVTPYGVDSKESLINYMLNSGYAYLLVFRGVSDVGALRPLFSSEGITSLNSHYQEIAYHKTDFFRIHLYQLAQSDYVDIESDEISKLDFGAIDSFTVTALMKTSNSGSTQYAVSKIAGPLVNNPGWALRKLSTDLFAFSVSDGINQVSARSNIALNDGNWHLVVGVRDSEIGKLYLYIDGVLQDEQPDDVTASLRNSAEFRIGNRGDNTLYWEGEIDKVAVHGRVLRGIEIENLYLHNTLISHGE
jgi:hypothetical protein